MSPNAAPASDRAVRIAAEQIRLVLDDAHALAAATGNGLDDERDSRWPRPLRRSRRRWRAGVEWLLGAGDDRNTGADGHGARGGLAAHERDGLGRRPDERQAGVAAGTRERRVLGQESVAGMDRVGAGSARDVEDRLDVEVAAGGLVWPEVERLMRLAHVARGTVAVGIDGDGRQPHLAACANDPNGDLAAVGDEDFH